MSGFKGLRINFSLPAACAINCVHGAVPSSFREEKE